MTGTESGQPAGAVDITENKDGGVLKEVKRAGTSTDKPRAGDKVSVHYVGTLTDGSEFDSSRKRGEYFTFQLGKGQVIKAWDLGVATMTRGELSVFTCRADYAYGERGSGSIPPNATLIFEVELFDWKGEDISPDKDNSITKSLIEDGSGYDTPNDGATVEVHLKGYHGDRVFQDEDIAFIVGEASEVGVIDGIEFAVKKFKKGESAQLKISAKHAYGLKGSTEYNIPANTDLVYEVKLNKFEKAKENWEMDAVEKLEQSEIVKAKGTNYFKASKFDLAQRYYMKIVDYLQSEDKLEGEEKQKREALLLAAYLNLAMCGLKLKKYLEVRENCDKALEMDSKNEKAFFRRGSASMQIQDFEDAIADFNRVLEVDPNNKAAKNQIIICQQTMKKIKEKEKQTYAGMFAKFAKIDAKRDPAYQVQSNSGDLFSGVHDWSNSMADGMLPLDQEMAAFGEKMPEPKYNCDDSQKENENPEDD
ncbi:hypothetical protein CAPTEDRAFT_173491 [Capitella teleta]|uniref:peptidylprolyl isomerase n=1 Tax=Capitella teleta TaxID=283909 RepID=R7U571_CAPTE|nr:hypothetical protein CAPTEDRAFT_173491 [Capitella teleta]|eukprot:ELU01505.1 hypothetical protein CAPTEDRAFT_173491 [Capitella teleta]